MAIAKRGKNLYLRVRLFDGKVQGVKTPAKTKAEAKQIEMAVMTAVRSGDYRALEPVSREVCIRLFKNQGLELPPDLVGSEPVQELTLLGAAEIFFKSPEIKDSPTRWRYECCMVNLVEKLGPDRPLKSIWVHDLKKYRMERLNEGASPGSINWDMSTLSKLYGVHIDLRLVDTNPVRLVRKLSVKSGERQVYISHDDFLRITNKCPAWFQRVTQTAYYTGMRRGEIIGLRRRQVKLSRRMILLGPEDTKEAHWKRVPVHLELVSGA